MRAIEFLSENHLRDLYRCERHFERIVDSLPGFELLIGNFYLPLAKRKGFKQ